MKKVKKVTMEKPRFKTNYNNYKSESDYEKVDPISITVPDETYSLRQIVEKFSREYPKALLRTGYSDDINENDPDFDDVDITRTPDFDYVDAFELKQQIKEKVNKRKVVNDVLGQEQNEVQITENQPSEV